MIPLVKTFIPPPEILMPELQRVLYSGYISQGEQVEMFENEFQNYIGSGYSLSLNSGTAALHIALQLCDVKNNDEVISTALTAEPTNVAIKMVGAKIRYADIDYDTGNISPSSIESKINKNTRAIIVVDYAGIPVNVPAIQLISKKHKIPIIHDAAHSLGSKFNNVMNGVHFPYTIFSFQAIKHITTIDGGILHLTNKRDYEKAKLIRWFGIDKNVSRLENNIKLQGFKYHMNNVNATIGILQLKYTQKIIESYIENGKYFDKNLKGINGVECINYYVGSEPSYWLYTLKVDKRNDFIKMMESNGIVATELHKRNDYHDYLNDFSECLPVLDIFYKKMVHLPCGWWLNDEIKDKIVSCIKNGW